MNYLAKLITNESALKDCDFVNRIILHRLKSQFYVKLLVESWKIMFKGVNSCSIYELHHEKICLRNFRPGQTQIRLYNHRRWLES